MNKKPSNQIIARRLLLISKNGHKTIYSPVTKFWVEFPELVVQGERDGSDGLRVNVEDSHFLDELLIMEVEFKVPIT